ncbi:MAG: IS3 family transposase [Clostridia bacterium]|nr:IS3 family transposase [Clostridia bacterium]
MNRKRTIKENRIFRNGKCLLKKIECLNSRQGKVKEKDKVKAISELRHQYKLMALLKVAGVAKSTYFYHISRMNKPDKDKSIKDQIQLIFDENKGRYGYRRITLELRNRGFNVNHKKVQRIMKELGIQSIQRPKRRYNSYKGTIGKVAPNLLKRNFKADKPNQKWATDVTEFKVNNQKLYLSPIIDLFNGEVISFNLSRHPVFQQVVDMLKKAFKKIPDNTNLILHSDQGWQYQMKQYQHLLKQKGIRQSMSRKGNCLDNACAENFFGLLKSELYYIKENEYNNIEELEKDIIEYIKYYNNRRIKSKLKGMTPVQYRIHSLQVA